MGRRTSVSTVDCNREISSAEARNESPYPKVSSMALPIPETINKRMFYASDLLTKVSSTALPIPETISKWMFYASDLLSGKSTVVCIHPRYFVTRHGGHLQLQIGSALRIFPAKSETNEGCEVTVVKIEESLGFIVLRSEKAIGPTGAPKSTVVCIHQRYFVTFRHGSHLQIQIGSLIRIFPGKVQPTEDQGRNVTVVDINEDLDFILFRSEEDICPKSPRLVPAEESENFLLAGFGDANTGKQHLIYSIGIVHTLGQFWTSDIKRPMIGPFFLGTVQSSPGDSGRGCWSAKGLIGTNYGVTLMPEATHSYVICTSGNLQPQEYYDSGDSN